MWVYFTSVCILLPRIQYLWLFLSLGKIYSVKCTNLQYTIWWVLKNVCTTYVTQLLSKYRTLSQSWKFWWPFSVHPVPMPPKANTVLISWFQLILELGFNGVIQYIHFRIRVLSAGTLLLSFIHAIVSVTSFFFIVD